MRLPMSVCLSVGRRQKLSIKHIGGVTCVAIDKRLAFGGDPDYIAD